jgi:Transposase DDE domain
MAEPRFSIWPESTTATVANSERSTVRRFPFRKIPRDQLEAARDIARSFVGTKAFEQSRRERKKIEMRFAYLKRILRLGRLRLRGPRGAQDEFVLAVIAQNLQRLAALGPDRRLLRFCALPSVGMGKQSQGERDKVGLLTRAPAAQSVAADFCNKICH